MAIKKFGKNQKPTTKQSNIKPDVLSDTWKKIKDRPSLIFYSLLIDGLFLLVAYIMSYAFNEMIVPNLGDRLPWRLAYLICLVAAYTILKFILLNNINGYFNKKETVMARIAGFFAVNIVLLAFFALSFFAAGVFLGIISGSPLIQLWLDLLYLAILIIFYPWMNISHTLFINGAGTFRSLTKGFSLIFTEFKAYSWIYLIYLGTSIALIILFLVGYFVLGQALKPEIMGSLSESIARTMSYVGMAAYFLVHVFCRVLYLNIANRLSQPKREA